MDFSVISENPLAMPNLDYAKKAADYLEQMMKDQDSCGGTIQCRINGLPAGIGEPVFDKLDANLAKAVMSIGSVKAVQIGDGIQVASSNGSQNNDAFYIEENQIAKKTNHAGGILGGISDGSEILLTASIKPTPSISQVPADCDRSVGRNRTDHQRTARSYHRPESRCCRRIYGSFIPC